MYYKRKIDAHSCNRCYSGKEISITYSECVPLALVTLNEMSMSRTMLSSMACLFSHYLINGTIFGSKFLNIKYALLLFTTFVF